MAKVVNVAASAGGVGHAVLTGVLDALGSVNRKIALGLANGTPFIWNSPRIYFFSGTADDGLPKELEPHHGLALAAHKTHGPVARGCAGVLSFYVPSANVTVALMWSVPFDYNLYSNWWNVAIVGGNKPASKTLFNQLYYHWVPFKGDSNFYSRTQLNDSWKFEGSMGHSGTPILNVIVSLVA